MIGAVAEPQDAAGIARTKFLKTFLLSQLSAFFRQGYCIAHSPRPLYQAIDCAIQKTSERLDLKGLSPGLLHNCDRGSQQNGG